MSDLLLDENISWRIARGLRDEDVFQYAQAHHLILVSRDSDFQLRFGLPHAGIILVQASFLARNADILTCLLAQLTAALAQPLVNHVYIIAC